MNKWHPINCAPKDGSYILVGNPEGVWIAKYEPIYQSGYRPDNPWASMMLNTRHMKNRWASLIPTHWMPLPNPPSAVVYEDIQSVEVPGK